MDTVEKRKVPSLPLSGIDLQPSGSHTTMILMNYNPHPELLERSEYQGGQNLEVDGKIILKWILGK
jgi:hypothetical protein